MFEKITRWFQGFLGDTQKSPLAPVRDSTQPINDFIARTQMNSPQQLSELGVLATTITPWEFADFCASFAKGVAYVADRFSACPKAIIIDDTDTFSPRYNIQTQTIFLSRKFIGANLSITTHRQSKTEPYVLSTSESAVIYGVEEAYHHYQATVQGEYYSKLPATTRPTSAGYTEGYDNHPLEYDAERIVRQAICHFGFDKHMYQMVPGTKPLTWQTRVEKTNTQQMPQVIAPQPAR